MKQYKYRAFISYSHADEKEADWLQHALESYVAPKAIVGKPTPWGPAPRKVTPVFRDRADLPAAGSLNAEIQAALSESLFQIVICSPSAARSRWVNEEIKFFKKLHGQERTLAVIVAGEPGASAVAGREEEECFPPALRFRVDAAGEVTDEPAEPIAADARRSGDGRRDARLKLVAGLLGVRLDDLIQREAARRTRHARMAMGASAALVTVMGALTLTAISARQQAQMMRGQAEDLIEFMLGDLRDKLEPVGKLDIMESVGQKALDYYELQNLKRIDGEALSRRARALLLVGYIHQRRHDYDAALTAYRAAAETTGEQLRRAPDNPQRIFDHAQAVFYVAYTAIERGELEAAEAGYQEYYRLAQQLVAIDPAKPEWRLEVAYSTSNLGTVKYNRGAYDEAAPYFEESVAIRRALSEESPEDSKMAREFAYALSWLAYNDLLRGHFAAAIATLDEQIGIYDALLAETPDNYEILGYLTTALRRLADARLSIGDVAGARRAIEKAKGIADKLFARDAEYGRWMLNIAYVENILSVHASLAGNQQEAAAYADRALALSRQVFDRDNSDTNALVANAVALSRRVDVGDNSAARDEAAAELAVRFQQLQNAPAARMLTPIGAAALGLARYYVQAGDTAEARKSARAGAELLASKEERLAVEARMMLANLFLETGEVKKARRLADELDALGLKHPHFAEFKRRLGLLVEK